MDRNSPDYYIEKNGEEETKRFIEESLRRNYKYVKPIITPRFTPSVSDSYMEFLGKLVQKYNLAVQSHLSENPEEIKLVKKLSQMIAFMLNPMINMDYLVINIKQLWHIVFILQKKKMN